MISVYSIPPFVGAVFAILLGAFVFLKDKRSAVHISFALFCLSLSVWLFGYMITYTIQDEKLAVFFARISCTGAMFTAPACYHFSVSYLRKDREKIAVLLSYLVFLLISPFSMTSDYFLSGVYKYYWGYYSKAGMLHPLYMVVFFGVFIRSFWLLYCGYRERKQMSFLKANQIKYIFFAYIMALMGAIDYIPKYGAGFYPFGFVFEIFFVSLIAYAILKYRAMNIHLVFKRTMAYSLAAGLLTGLFVVLVLTITNLISDFAYVSSFKVNVLAAIIIALLFNPLRTRIQNLVDKIFFKRSYDYYSAIREVSQELSTVFDRQKIYDLVGKTILLTLGLKNIAILSSVRTGGYELAYHLTSDRHRGKRKKNGPDKDEKPPSVHEYSGLVYFFRRSGEILILDELSGTEKEFGQRATERIRRDLTVLEAESVVPVFIDGKLAQCIALGEKLSGDILSDEDLNLLKTISHQTAVAIKNAKMYQDKMHSERLASIGMMSATFAHEIRNPLTSLKTFAQLMPEKYNDIEFRDTFSKIVVGEIEKIDGLISDLLDFSADKKSSRINNFNLNELLNDIINNVEGKLLLERSGIIIEKNYNGDFISMTGDAVKLKQAFGNIILNGCQAMNGEGVLRVAIEKKVKNVDVAIYDTGDGIQPEDLPKIFDPFVTTKKMGVGLGLAISKRIIEDHNGKIHVKSRPEKGTVFTITLPVQIV